MLIIIRGLPGVGKTFLAHRDYPGSLLLEGDQYFTDENGKYDFGKGMLPNSTEYVKLMLATALATGIKSVVITGTSPDGETAQEYASIAKGFGHKVKFVWLDYIGMAKTVHAVPEDVINKMKKNWKPIRGEILIVRQHDPTIFDRDNMTYKVVKDFPGWYKKLHPNKKRS